MLTPPRLNFSLLILLILATDSPVYQKHVILLPTSSGKQLGLVFPRCSTEQQTALPICLPLQIPFRQSSFLAASMIKNSLSIRMPVTQSKIAGARTEQGFCFVLFEVNLIYCVVSTETGILTVGARQKQLNTKRTWQRGHLSEN